MQFEENEPLLSSGKSGFAEIFDIWHKGVHDLLKLLVARLNRIDFGTGLGDLLIVQCSHISNGQRTSCLVMSSKGYGCDLRLSEKHAHLLLLDQVSRLCKFIFKAYKSLWGQPPCFMFQTNLEKLLRVVPLSPSLEAMRFSIHGPIGTVGSTSDQELDSIRSISLNLIRSVAFHCLNETQEKVHRDLDLLSLACEYRFGVERTRNRVWYEVYLSEMSVRTYSSTIPDEAIERYGDKLLGFYSEVSVRTYSSLRNRFEVSK
ncbi:hypothetical protein L1887_29706 [Cichorium endivia]|nr:hypothetical protein L1887_29706 [Cichorium endivia]